MRRLVYEPIGVLLTTLFAIHCWTLFDVHHRLGKMW